MGTILLNDISDWTDGKTELKYPTREDMVASYKYILMFVKNNKNFKFHIKPNINTIKIWRREPQ